MQTPPSWTPRKAECSSFPIQPWTRGVLSNAKKEVWVEVHQVSALWCDSPGPGNGHCYHSPDSPASNQTGPWGPGWLLLPPAPGPSFCGGHKQWVPQVCAFSFMYSHFFFFWPLGSMWDLSSQTVDRTCVPCIRRISTTGHPGKSLIHFFWNEHIFSSQKKWTICVAKINKKKIKKITYKSSKRKEKNKFKQQTEEIL